MALILAIQPDGRQAAILSGVVMNQLRADLVLVDSKDAALACIRTRVPDLILLAAELGRPDDEAFAEKLKKIRNAEHLRTLSMPPLGSSAEEEEQSGGGLLKAFKRKRVETRRRGRDPKLFAKELRSYLKRAERIKADRRSEAGLPAPAPMDPPVPAPAVEPAPLPSVEPASTSAAEPAAPPVATSAPSQPPPALPAAPERVITFGAIETRVAASVGKIDDTAAERDSDADAMIRALRVPLLVAGVSYPRGCRIGRIRLARALRQPVIAMRRRVMEPPPTGRSTTPRYQAAW